jgi:hypothetical protein
MIMKIVDRGTVFGGAAGSDRQSAAFPAVAVTPGGRWLSAFRAAPGKSPLAGQRVLLTWSDDEGSSWCEPVDPFTPGAVEGKPGLFRAAGLTALGDRTVLAVLCWVDQSEPDLPYYNAETRGLLDTRIFLSWSRDEGARWSAPELVETPAFRVPTPITGPILRLASGELACQFEVNKHYRDTSEWRHASALLFSRDGGRSWPEHSIASSDPENRFFYWDQRPGVVDNGRVLDVFWTYDNRTAAYLDIHARESLDHGRTWSEMWDTGISGQPASPLLLPGGIVALVFVDRTGAPAIKLRTSTDGGRTWPAASEVVLYGAVVATQTTAKTTMNDAWSEMAKFSVGLPATARTVEGDLLVAYYAGPHFDRTSIEWVRVGS